jgi:hypothetical protein
MKFFPNPSQVKSSNNSMILVWKKKSLTLQKTWIQVDFLKSNRKETAGRWFKLVRQYFKERNVQQIKASNLIKLHKMIS